MRNLELFDDVTITFHDVEYWLRTDPRFDNNTALTRIEAYIKSYDVVNKIKAEKSKCSIVFFNQTLERDKENLSHAIEALSKPRFKPVQITPFHEVKRREKSRNKAALFHTVP